MTAEICAKKSDGDARDLRSTLLAVYPELRRIARGLLARERRYHTLQPTALANEVIARLLRREAAGEDQRSVVFAGIREMQTILIDSGKKRRRRQLVPMDPVLLETETELPLEGIIHLQLQLVSLGEVDPRAREVVELRFFAGLTIREAAEFLGRSVRAVNDDWDYARCWLAKHWADS